MPTTEKGGVGAGYAEILLGFIIIIVLRTSDQRENTV